MRRGIEIGTSRVKQSQQISQAFKDTIVMLVLAVLLFAVSATFDVFDKIISWVYRHNTWQLDEFFTVGIYFVVAIVVYAWRRYREMVDQIHQREKAEAEKARLIPELQNALADIHTLQKLLPMCSSCKSIRDDRGYWDSVEVYIETHFATTFDNGICPDCVRKLYRSNFKPNQTEPRYLK